jgi:2-oxoglutarate dehydrogenase E1 component
MKRDFVKPLIVMAPKSLLRHPAATSKIAEFTSGTFNEILDDPLLGQEAAAPGAPPPKATRLIFCSGKVYYDLCDYRDRNKLADVAIVRIEQLYPLHRNRISELADYYAGARVVWCQEEPQNMGAWSFIAPQLAELFGFTPLYAGRDPAASPAVGSLALHKLELSAFLHSAFML